MFIKDFDTVIIGAGLVGLAAAYQLKKQHPDKKIAVIEKEEGPARHQSGHNSGVIHSGVYYKPGSLKAKNCIAGRKELLDFCEKQGVSYQTLPKVIVATKAQEIGRLEEIFARGCANKVPGIEMIGGKRLEEIEPYAVGIQAILIPQCAVVHFPEVAEALCRWLKENECELFFGEEVVGFGEESVETLKRRYQAETIINCAGLHSDRVASLSGAAVSSRIIPFRGEYYMLKEEAAKKVRGLIYPVPDPKFPFLGVHLTRMISGGVEAGPNAVMAFAREGYRKTDFQAADLLATLRYSGFWKMALRYWKAGCYELYRSMSKKAFLKDLQRLMPSIREEDLIPGGAGVRAQLVTREGKMADDFSIIKQKKMVHVLNAPSPAATASFAIGRQIAGMVLP